MEERTYVDGFHHRSEVSKMTYRELGSTGLRVSVLSLGGGPFGGFYEQQLGEEEAICIIREAFKCGINYIDTAPWYGQGRSEALIGKALKGIPRQAYYIGTKVGRYELEVEKMFDFSATKIRQGFDRSLALLGLDYVDLLQVHDVEFAEDLEQIVKETLPAVKEIVKEGKARFVGVTGYPLKDLKDVVSRSSVAVDAVLSYARMTLVDASLKDELPFFKERGLGVINASMVALGLLTPGGPPPWHPATPEIREACHQAKEYCQEHNLDFSRLAIQYSMLTPGIATHLVGVGTLPVLTQNLETATRKPTEEELENMEELRKRFFAPLSCPNWEGNEVTMKRLKEIREKKSIK